MGGCCAGSNSQHQNQERASYGDDKEEGAKENKIKLLFLGAGESGKTTLFKQIKINYLASYSSNSLVDEKLKIQHSVRFHFADLISVIYSLGGFPDDLDLQEMSEKYFPIVTPGEKVSAPNMFTDELIDFMTQIWNSERGQKIWKERNKYPLTDSLEYFMDNLDRVKQEKYVPTEMDYLKCRIITAGIMEQTFLYRGVSILVVDVGGQRSERRKWLRCFDGVTAILFVASVSDFDQVLYEDVRDQRLPDAIGLFTRTVSSHFFKTVPFVLFLNKQDLLQEKLRIMEEANRDLNEYFPDLNLGKNYENAFPKVQQHMQNLFMRGVPEERRDYVFPHLVVATDSGSFKRIFQAATTIILTEALDTV